VLNTLDRTTVAGLGEICVSREPGVTLACLGLGSCIGLCAYDPVARVAGLAHIVLPESNHNESSKVSGKYADIAVPLLFAEMCKHGAVKSRLVVKLVGGARMIQSAGFDPVFEMGPRNLEMTKKALAAEGVRVAAADTGGNLGRSLWLEVRSGKVLTKTTGAVPREL